ncbi:hypothetical protein NGM99_12650 [Mesorhizobium sp. RP14(2022)]|uniref:Uncharacterized protein n=1 Tax=Mesorhizobium liriopis TaxID=2953882 RepID=A0ABT1C821_9HYPH|nr:hypothetical protein [Mesorhizobium liriopis]MCO6050633.1 hypothetical protein [Mesorhizobium liriopis]
MTEFVQFRIAFEHRHECGQHVIYPAFWSGNVKPEVAEAARAAGVLAPVKESKTKGPRRKGNRIGRQRNPRAPLTLGMGFGSIVRRSSEFASSYLGGSARPATPSAASAPHTEPYECRGPVRALESESRVYGRPSPHASLRAAQDRFARAEAVFAKHGVEMPESFPDETNTFTEASRFRRDL